MVLVGFLCPLVGKEFPEGFTVVFIAGDTQQHILYPRAGIHAPRLAGVHQGVDDGRTDGGIVVPAEQEVLPAQGQRPDGILHEVVVNAEASVVHIAAQSGEQRQCIADGLPDAAVLRCPPGGLVHPLV